MSNRATENRMQSESVELWKTYSRLNVRGKLCDRLVRKWIRSDVVNTKDIDAFKVFLDKKRSKIFRVRELRLSKPQRSKYFEPLSAWNYELTGHSHNRCSVALMMRRYL